MNAASIGAAATVAGVVVTILGGLAILIWNAGHHSQRLNRAEGDIRDIREKDLKELKDRQEEHSRSISAWDQAMHLLQEVRDDVKWLTTGKAQPGRRPPKDG